ncbi:MAG: PAQR family membrane homeostasis protein TrhA [Janthinobacterium lividum]
MKQTEARPQTLGEEIANSVSHSAGFVLALIGAGVFISLMRRGDASVAGIGLGIAVYIASMLALYSMSAIYHALPNGRVKRVFMKLDYCAIYIFIAGTYTPFAIRLLPARSGTLLLIGIWTMAALGLLLQALGRLAHPLLSTGLYLLMGWIGVLVAGPMIALLPVAALAWLLAGGLCYTGGVAFFLLDSRLKYAHLVWHLFVLAGSVCHFIAIAVSA